MDFYKILMEIMAEKDMSIPSVARACGLADGTVRSMIARKAKSVSLEVAFKLSDGLKISLERLNDMPEPTISPPAPTDIGREELCTIYDAVNTERKTDILKHARFVKHEYDTEAAELEAGSKGVG